MKTVTCTYHCGSCGLHFHALEAFDAHRKGDYASNDPEVGRHCVHPFDLDGRLVVLTDAGECRMYDDGSGLRVKRLETIWTSDRTKGTRPWETSHGAAERSGQRPGAQIEAAGPELVP